MKLTTNQTKISKFLSLVLRHQPEKAHIKLDKEGWANVSDILTNLNIDMNELELIVEENDKKRFSFNETKDKIRASQGHSIKEVEIKLEELKNVPTLFYHGTKEDFLKSIMKSGLIKGNRNHVHLSIDEQTAQKVADRRKGKSIILKIAAMHMRADGFKFYKSENGVILINSVPAKYITF